MSHCLVTCGPASTRIDQVRRITNSSTGELGTLLAETLQKEGHRVTCLRGEGATFRKPVGVNLQSFFSNDELLIHLENISKTQVIDIFFHAAALTDFEVSSVADSQGNPLVRDKIPSSLAQLVIRLQPATKVISHLRRLFPKAGIVGWKYEVEGKREDAVARAVKQIAENQTDACVVNGAAYGTGFAWVRGEERQDFTDKTALVRFLLNTQRMQRPS